MKNFLENQLNKLITYVNKTNQGFGWKNNANRNHEGVYIEGEPFDYIIITPSKTLLFDAKEKEKGFKWYMKAKDKKQLLNLKKLYHLDPDRNDCFFLIYFAQFIELRKIHVDKVFKILGSRNYIERKDCDIWKFKDEFKIG